MSDALAALRAEIERKRKQVPGGGAAGRPVQKRWRRMADLEKERESRYQEEEAKYRSQLELKRARIRQEYEALAAQSSRKVSGSERGDAVNGTVTESAVTTHSKCSTQAGFSEEREGSPPLNKKEVFRRLRALGEPVTLFGEGEWERFDRLRELELAREELSEGQRNVFQTKMREMREKDAVDEVYRLVGAELPQLARAEKTSAAKRTPPVHTDDAPDKDAITKEDYVYKKVRHYQSLWQQEIDAMPPEERRTSRGRSTVVTCEQTKEWLKPLIKLLRKRKLQRNILNALKNIFEAVEEREYVKANSLYLEQLAIGNAPWPMGATMVGIHARAAREKIGEDKIAHVMNDEQTRKYIQAVKRLMTVAQRHYPTVPSKMIA